MITTTLRDVFAGLQPGETRTISELLDELADRGHRWTDNKKVYSALSYLTRRGEIRRLNYSRYTAPEQSAQEKRLGTHRERSTA